MQEFRALAKATGYVLTAPTVMRHLGLGRPATEDEIKLVRWGIKRSDSAYMLVDGSLERRDFSLGNVAPLFASDFQAIANLKELAKFCSYRAVVAAHDGEPATCERSLRVMFRMVGQLSEGGSSLRQIVALALSSMANATVQAVLVESRLDPTYLSLCERVYSEAPESMDLAAAIKYDAAVAYAEMTMSQAEARDYIVKSFSRGLEVSALVDAAFPRPKAQKVSQTEQRKLDAMIARNLDLYTRAYRAVKAARSTREQGNQLLRIFPTAPADDSTAPDFVQLAVLIRRYELMRQSYMAGIGLLSRIRWDFPEELNSDFKRLLPNGVTYLRTATGFRLDAPPFDIRTTTAPKADQMAFIYPKLKGR